MKHVGVWGVIETIVADELGALLDANFRPIVEPFESPLYTSVIPLTLTNDHLLIRLGIGVDERARTHLQDVLLGGDRSNEAMCDALREMANTAGGAISRAAMQDGTSIALGLPSNENPFVDVVGKRRKWRMTDDNGLCIECVVSAHESAPRPVRASALTEGMVIAMEVLDAAGGTLAMAGTRVTQTLAASLAFMLGEQDVYVTFT